MTDGPADERCETCHRLDPINCPCPPEENPVDYEIWPATATVSVATHETLPALVETADERIRQVAKWGVQSWPDGTGGLMEALKASMAKAKTDMAARNGSLTWRDILDEEVVEAYAESDPVKLRTELLQVAAVAVSWVEDIDRKGGTEAASERALAKLREALADGSPVARDISSGRLPLAQPGELRVTEDGAALARIAASINGVPE